MAVVHDQGQQLELQRTTAKLAGLSSTLEILAHLGMKAMMNEAKTAADALEMLHKLGAPLSLIDETQLSDTEQIVLPE